MQSNCSCIINCSRKVIAVEKQYLAKKSYLGTFQWSQVPERVRLDAKDDTDLCFQDLLVSLLLMLDYSLAYVL